MLTFKMSEPRLASRVVEQLESLGYGASIDAPHPEDTHAFVSVWAMDGDKDLVSIRALVHDLDQGSEEQHASVDPFDPGPLPQDQDRPDEPKEQPSDRAGEPVVHPRWVWIGTATAVIGVVVTGIGVMVQTPWVWAPGVAVLVVAAVVMWRSGAMFAVQSTRSLAHELDEVESGDSYEGTEPGQMVEDPDIQRSAATIERRRRSILSRRSGGGSPGTHRRDP